MIYLDNAATTMHKPEGVIDAVVNAMRNMGNAGRGANDASLDAARMIFDTRVKLTDFFHGEDPRQLAFTMNSTESLNMAIQGILEPGDHVITTVLEHNSVLRPIYKMMEKGVRASFVGCDENGSLKYEQFESLIEEETKAIICTAGSNVTGNLTDLARVGRIAVNHDLLFVVDASQTAGVFDINVKDMGIDILCFTGHKGLYGPQGTGGLYVRPGVKVKSLLAGGSGVKTFQKSHPAEMPTALEAGTLNGHGIAGLNAAMDFLTETGIKNIREKEISLMKRFYEGIKDIPGVKIYGDFSDYNRCAIVSMNLGDYASGEVSDELMTRFGISTRSGGHCAPLMHEAFQTVDQGMVRFSFSWFNTEEEIDEAIEAVRILATE